MDYLMKDRPRQPHRGWECIATVDLNPDEAAADEVDYETCQVTTARPPPPPPRPASRPRLARGGNRV